jgi:hypothetical protein
MDGAAVAKGPLAGDEVVELVEVFRMAVETPVPGDLALIAQVVDEDDVLEAHIALQSLLSSWPCPLPKSGFVKTCINFGYISSKREIAKGTEAYYK